MQISSTSGHLICSSADFEFELGYFGLTSGDWDKIGVKARDLGDLKVVSMDSLVKSWDLVIASADLQVDSKHLEENTVFGEVGVGKS